MNDAPVPANVEVIRVHVGELRQMFNSMDPAPFHARDLDPNAEVVYRRVGERSVTQGDTGIEYPRR